MTTGQALYWSKGSSGVFVRCFRREKRDIQVQLERHWPATHTLLMRVFDKVQLQGSYDLKLHLFPHFAGHVILGISMCKNATLNFSMGFKDSTCC